MPERAVLMAYSKMAMFDDLLASDLPEDSTMKCFPDGNVIFRRAAAPASMRRISSIRRDRGCDGRVDTRSPRKLSASNSAMWMGDAALWGRDFRLYAVDVLGEPGLSSEARPTLASGVGGTRRCPMDVLPTMRPLRARLLDPAGGVAPG